MIERERFRRILPWKSRNLCCESTIAALFICFCSSLMINTVNSDTSVPPNISHNEQQLNVESNVSTTTIINSTSIQSNLTASVAMNEIVNTSVEVSVNDRPVKLSERTPQTKDHPFMDSIRSSTMSYCSMQDEVKMYEDDAVFVPYDVEASDNDCENDYFFSRQPLIPNTTFANSDTDEMSVDEAIAIPVNETILSTEFPPEIDPTLNHSSTHEHNKQYTSNHITQNQKDNEEVKGEQAVFEPKSGINLARGLLDTSSEFLSKIESPLLVVDRTNDTLTTTPSSPLADKGRKLATPDDIHEIGKKSDESKNNSILEEKPKPEHQVCYYCTTVWGDTNVTRRHRPMTSLLILEQIFHGSIKPADDMNASNVVTARTYNTTTIRRQIHKKNHSNTNNDTEKIQFHDDSIRASPPKMMGSMDESHGDGIGAFDDIAELFKDADLSDEFYADSNDETVQEILMRSATRMVFKHCTIAGRFILNKVRTAQKFLLHKATKLTENNPTIQKLTNQFSNAKELKWLPKSNKGEFAHFKWMQNDNGEFVPLHRFRNAEGDWIFLQKLRENDSLFLGMSLWQIQKGLEWVQRSALNAFKKIDEVVDKMLSGLNNDENDELEFKFLSDHDFSTKNAVPAA